jgi:hypothetical protein
MMTARKHPRELPDHDLHDRIITGKYPLLPEQQGSLYDGRTTIINN